MPQRFTLEDMASCSKAALADLILDLPPEIGQRLKLQRVAQRHGTEMRMFLFHIWDIHQPKLLDYKHFSYGVIYDPAQRYHRKPLLLRFYANRHRIYDKRSEVVSALWAEMQTAETVLFGFKAEENEQMIGLFRYFTALNVDELKQQIYQGFLELIPYWHPRYAAVVDSYGTSLSSEEIRDVISGRKKFQHSGPRSPVARPEYSRHVPLRLREKVFARDGGKCLKCGTTENLHADHILPVSLGGLTVIENLQTLCAAENLSKGNRESTDYRSAK